MPDKDTSLVKSRDRVVNYGEVFTPDWVVAKMLSLVSNEVERIDSRFLEPACGNGNFLISILVKKLEYVKKLHSKNEFDRSHHALLALMSLYGIDLLGDNIFECRSLLLNCFNDFLGIDKNNDISKAAQKVLQSNIVHGNALSFLMESGDPIIFPEWSYLGSGKYKRRDFSFNTLTQMSNWDENTLFADLGKADVFIPVKDFPPQTVQELLNE